MIKNALYGAVAGGLLVAATAVSPVVAAPAVKAKPEVQTNTTDAQYYYYGHRRHRHHHHDGPYGYYYAPGYYANPGVGIYVRPW